MSLSDLPNELSERGIWWQVGGFAIAGCASVAILQIWDGSDFWAYRSFEIAAKDLYWMFVVPLAGLFEGVRELFAKMSEIRAAQREKMRRKERAKGEKVGEARMRHRLQGASVEKDPATGRMTMTLSVSPEDVEYLLGERGEAIDR